MLLGNFSCLEVIRNILKFSLKYLKVLPLVLKFLNHVGFPPLWIKQFHVLFINSLSLPWGPPMLSLLFPWLCLQALLIYPCMNTSFLYSIAVKCLETFPFLPYYSFKKYLGYSWTLIFSYTFWNQFVKLLKKFWILIVGFWYKYCWIYSSIWRSMTSL